MEKVVSLISAVLLCVGFSSFEKSTTFKEDFIEQQQSRAKWTDLKSDCTRIGTSCFVDSLPTVIIPL